MKLHSNNSWPSHRRQRRERQEWHCHQCSRIALVLRLQSHLQSKVEAPSSFLQDHQLQLHPLRQVRLQVQAQAYWRTCSSPQCHQCGGHKMPGGSKCQARSDLVEQAYLPTLLAFRLERAWLQTHLALLALHPLQLPHWLGRDPTIHISLQLYQEQLELWSQH